MVVVGLIEDTVGAVVVGVVGDVGDVGVVPVDEVPPQPVRIADATRHKQTKRPEMDFMRGNHKS
jgi:hypothetical protein